MVTAGLVEAMVAVVKAVAVVVAVVSAPVAAEAVKTAKPSKAAVVVSAAAAANTIKIMIAVAMVSIRGVRVPIAIPGLLSTNHVSNPLQMTREEGESHLPKS